MEDVLQGCGDQGCSGNFGFGGTLDGGTEGPERGAGARSAAAPRGLSLGRGAVAPPQYGGLGGYAARKIFRKSTLKSRIFGSACNKIR